MSKTSIQDGYQKSGFLHLPQELRDKIYSLLLVRGALHVQDLDRYADSDDSVEESYCTPIERNTGILSVSKQISNEALDILYGCNLFVVHIHYGAHHKLVKLGNNIQRIRRLELVAQPTDFYDMEPMKMDPLLWVPLLSRLNRLCLVLQQPMQTESYYHTRNLGEDIKKWLAWLEPGLKYLAGHVASTTLVEVDDNNSVETDELVKKYFTPGFKKVETITGDVIFRRAEFAWGSDYWDDEGGTNFADGGMGDDWGD